MTKSLELRVIRPPVPINPADYALVKTLGAAWEQCAKYAGSQDKSLAADTGLDASTWTKMKANEAGVKGLQGDLIMDACGNDFPLLWWLYQRGYDPSSLRRRESEVERENRELREQLDQMKLERRHIEDFVRRTAGAR